MLGDNLIVRINADLLGLYPVMRLIKIARCNISAFYIRLIFTDLLDILGFAIERNVINIGIDRPAGPFVKIVVYSIAGEICVFLRDLDIAFCDGLAGIKIDYDLFTGKLDVFIVDGDITCADDLLLFVEVFDFVAVDDYRRLWLHLLGEGRSGKQNQTADYNEIASSLRSSQ